MKTLNLTNDQLTLISEQNPEWVAYNRHAWMCDNRPREMANNRYKPSPEIDNVPDYIEKLLK